MIDVRSFYADLGVDLPNWGGDNVAVRCFANPDAHRRDDRNASMSVNVHTGAYFCHGCSERGGGYDAAVTLGRTPRQAMELLERHGLKRDDATVVPERRPFAVGEQDVQRYRRELLARPRVLGRLGELRGWTEEAIRHLGVGLDGDRVTFPMRDASSALVGIVRYSPAPDRRGVKSLAAPGSRRTLFPPPEFVPGETVWIVEGEPDAVAAHSIGLPAVAIPGTNGWRSSYADRFTGRRVVVCLDCDAPGRTAAHAIAADLAHHGVDVRVLDLDRQRDDGHDLGDFLADARTEEDRACALTILKRLADRLHEGAQAQVAA